MVSWNKLGNIFVHKLDLKLCAFDARYVIYGGVYGELIT